MAGGYNGASYPTALEIFDPLTMAFTGGGNLLAGRANHTATRLSNGFILVAGGWNGRQRWLGM